MVFKGSCARRWKRLLNGSSELEDQYTKEWRPVWDPNKEQGESNTSPRTLILGLRKREIEFLGITDGSRWICCDRWCQRGCDLLVPGTQMNAENCASTPAARPVFIILHPPASCSSRSFSPPIEASKFLGELVFRRQKGGNCDTSTRGGSSEGACCACRARAARYQASRTVLYRQAAEAIRSLVSLKRICHWTLMTQNQFGHERAIAAKPRAC